MSKRRQSRVPHEMVEIIHEKLPVKSLLRFKAVCKLWKFTIESPRFQERQLIRRRQLRDPDVLFVVLDDDIDVGEARRGRIMFGSSLICTVKLTSSSTEVCHGCCDGLVCLYGMRFNTLSFVVNPATRWQRSFPLSTVQRLFIENRSHPCPKLGFGKDKVTGTYKPVWLYNSSEYGLENITTCEVFDFSTNAWRYLVLASPHRILSNHQPVYLDGSLYWFTEGNETKVLSFNLHTEAFQVISDAPFPHVDDPRDPCDFTMCILDNSLCVSLKIWPTQHIWSFDYANMTWNLLCSIDLTRTGPWFGETASALFPIALLEQDKLLLHSGQYLEPLLIHDLHANSYEVLFTPTNAGSFLSCSQSLFSIVDGVAAAPALT
ncbi:unnamed protein product [Arabidopsis halleri]